MTEHSSSTPMDIVTALAQQQWVVDFLIRSAQAHFITVGGSPEPAADHTDKSLTDRTEMLSKVLNPTRPYEITVAQIQSSLQQDLANTLKQQGIELPEPTQHQLVDVVMQVIGHHCGRHDLFAAYDPEQLHHDLQPISEALNEAYQQRDAHSALPEAAANEAERSGSLVR